MTTRRDKAIAAFVNNEGPKKPAPKSKSAKAQKAAETDDEPVPQVDMGISVKRKDDKLEYKRLQLHEQILLRPDTYIGSVKTTRTEEPEWTLDKSEKSFVKSHLNVNDGLLRIFIEIISNAIDNVWRSLEADITPKFIKVDITEDSLRVWNDGRNISTATHPTEGIPIPELIFGHLLTSSNYNDAEEDRKTSGRNGLGCKLTVLFSKEFKLTIFNKEEKTLYTQTWSDNMKTRSVPEISKKNLPKTAEEGKNGFTCVEWKPDFSRFGMTRLDETHIQLLKKYVIDAAMTVSFHKVKVILNGTEIAMPSVKEYIGYYFGGKLPEDSLLLGDDVCKVWVGPSDEWSHVSFVNGIYTKEGGIHVDAWSKAIFGGVSEKLKSKKIDADLRDIRKHFFLFVFCSIDKPSFNTQSKTKLNGPKVSADVPATAINKILKWPFVDKIKSSLQAKDLAALKNETERKRGRVNVEGLDDANLATSGKSKECILCVTEGLSAATYVVTGMKYGLFGKKGRDYIGVLPIRGKFVNVKNASRTTLMNNTEVKSLIQALGLQHGVDYTVEDNRKKLRYNRLVVCTDADCDGSHITGLLYNFFHTLFPTLLRTDFFYFMRVPIVKILKKPVAKFYYQEQAREYISKNKIKSEAVKYFKGLGTANAKDIEEDFGKRLVKLICDEKTNDVMENIFSKENADFRKDWLQSFNPREVYPDIKDGQIEDLAASQFINDEMINFSLDDCRRSIPSVLDGLKESQRKVLYAAFKRGLNYKGESLKVAQFAGYVAEHSNYHHGENNLNDTITKMAQRFVGANNIPLLYNDGMFGTRIQLGKDAGAARYIFTKLDVLTRSLFIKEDEAYLPDREDDGDVVEKETYMPIVPMILVNGCLAGIGTGWSCQVPAHKLEDIVQWIFDWLDGSSTENIKPWYRGFKGELTVEDKKIITKGVYREVKTTGSTWTYNVTEIPLGKKMTSIAKYKEKLMEMLEEGKLKSVVDNSTEEKIDFTVTTGTQIKDHEELHLTDVMYTNNMVLFDQNNRLKRYETVGEILREFCEERLDLYGIRKAGVLNVMKRELDLLSFKIKFIGEVLSGSIDLRGKDEGALGSELTSKGYKKFDEGYDYLLNIQVRSMTAKRVQSLTEEHKELQGAVKAYEGKKPADIWREELKKLLAEWKGAFAN
jgi:DNA topoisomerase-2